MRARELMPHEVALLRQLRLRALTDSPTAFGQPLAEAEAQPDAYWENLARGPVGPGGWITVLAEESGSAVGLAFGILGRDDAPGTGRVAGMWVEPAVRARGAGRVLLAAIIEWAARHGVARLELWVTEGNTAAIALYERLGFADTGGRDALRSHPGFTTRHMLLDIAARSGSAPPHPPQTRLEPRSSGRGL